MYRDHNCGELNIKNVNEEVMLAGWVQRIRNLGEIEFVDLRDEKGITQLVISNDLKEIMDNVLDKLKGKNAKKLADLSHKFKGWIETNNEELISYSYAKDFELQKNW